MTVPNRRTVHSSSCVHHAVLLFAFSLLFLERKTFPVVTEDQKTMNWSVLSHSHQVCVRYSHMWRAGPVGGRTGPDAPGAPSVAVSGCCRLIFSLGVRWRGSKLWWLFAGCRFASSKTHQSGRNCEIIEIHCALLSADRTIRTCPWDAEEWRPQVCPGCILPHVKVISWHQLKRQLIESVRHVRHKAAAPCSRVMCHSGPETELTARRVSTPTAAYVNQTRFYV